MTGCHSPASTLQFTGAGGNPPEYSAAVKAAIDRGYMTMHPSGESVVHPSRRGFVRVAKWR
jgi:hypothetical protein